MLFHLLPLNQLKGDITEVSLSPALKPSLSNPMLLRVAIVTMQKKSVAPVATV